MCAQYSTIKANNTRLSVDQYGTSIFGVQHAGGPGSVAEGKKEDTLVYFGMAWRQFVREYENAKFLVTHGALQHDNTSIPSRLAWSGILWIG